MQKDGTWGIASRGCYSHVKADDGWTVAWLIRDHWHSMLISVDPSSIRPLDCGSEYVLIAKAFHVPADKMNMIRTFQIHPLRHILGQFQTIHLFLIFNLPPEMLRGLATSYLAPRLLLQKLLSRFRPEVM